MKVLVPVAVPEVEDEAAVAAPLIELNPDLLLDRYHPVVLGADRPHPNVRDPGLGGFDEGQVPAVRRKQRRAAAAHPQEDDSGDERLGLGGRNGGGDDGQQGRDQGGGAGDGDDGPWAFYHRSPSLTRYY